MALQDALFDLKAKTVRRSAGRYFDELLRNERLPQEELLQLQARRAAELGRFAARNTGYYRRLFEDAGIDLSALEEQSEWRKIPVTDRTTMKANAVDVSSTESTSRTARPAKTGGSTGEPLRTAHDARVPNLALAWRMYGWWGIKPSDNLARIGRWGFGAKADLKNAISWWPSRQLYLDASLISTAMMEQFYAQLRRAKPLLLEGYVGAMIEFADFLSARNLSIPSLRAISTTAAPLPESTRAHLEAAFVAPVYDEYRSSEVAWIAGECRAQNGLHIFSDARLIEVLDDAGETVPAGTTGNLVITDLTNRVFPIVRYRTGDRGALETGACPCGVTLPLMRKPEGRETDVLRLPSGKVLNHLLNGMFGAYASSVRLFQIHQRADYSIVVRVVRGEDPEAEMHVETAVNGLRARIENEVPVAVEFVDSLPYTGGKTKYVISEVTPQP